MHNRTPAHQAGVTGFLFLVCTALGWGLNWPAMRIILRDWPPLFARGVTGVLAAIILFAIAAANRERLSVPRKTWGSLFLATFTNVFAWMGFTTIAMTTLSISEAALLVYTMPIWATLLAWPVLGSRPKPRDIVGLVLGFAGLFVLFSGHPLGFGSGKIVGIGLALAGAILFALGSLLIARSLPVSPISFVAWQIFLGCVPMVVFGLAFEHPDLGGLKPDSAFALAYMTLVPMGTCYLTWYAAIRRLSAATAAIGMLSVPVIGILSGAWFVGESVGWREIGAVVLTLAGVALALWKPRPAMEQGV
ncbi:MAG: DMT family transporter [Bradyrhizobiaceae bacterium]|nr:MAG: DMT family transporter [Bradyrhizobiaceae bacterium]